MIKIAALNEESDEDSDSEEEVTREALEQIALQQYTKALELQRKGNLSDAIKLLKDLLETELLYEVKKPVPGEKSTEPLYNLKYLCFKNLASMLSSTSELQNAIEAYTAAADLDDTDVTLWYRLGLLCMKVEEYERALNAFQCGVDCNPRHWPCLDKIVTLQMAMGYHSDCMTTIYDTLKLDSSYLRGLVYRKHIYTNYRYVIDFLIYLNPKYKWDEQSGEPFDEEMSEKLLKEAKDINNIYLEQLKSNDFKCIHPQMKLRKPISELTWKSVGESLVHMHSYLTENLYSHTCLIEINFEKVEQRELMEVVEEEKQTEINEIKLDDTATEIDKNVENGSDENNELSDKAATDTEKVESDVEVQPSENPNDTNNISEIKDTKKTSVRRRGSALSFLEQWEWCTKRRSGRKKPVNKQDRSDENIYDTLRRMVPTWLVPENTKERQNNIREHSPDTMDLYKLFDDKEHATATNQNGQEQKSNYFGNESEQKDVKEYIDKFTKNKCDIINLLQVYLTVLSEKNGLVWPCGLWNVYVEANKCYNTHIDVPSCRDENEKELLHYTAVNILSEEFIINDKLNSQCNPKQTHELNIIENIGLMLTHKPNVYGTQCLNLMLKYLWLKLHIHLLNKNDELALDCLYQLFYEFDAMDEHHDTYSLEVVNFTFKPLINENEVMAYIKFFERNKQLSTVLQLFDEGLYEEVLSIVIDSFEHCKNIARKQEEEMSLDFAVQLSLILDCYWALGKVEDCFKWSLTCLNEALKHYFLANPETPERNKWSLATVKVLYCIEHILSKEGLSCLEVLSQKELSMCLEDLIRIIGHQVESNSTEMPFGTVIPWILIHYILQREDDQGRSLRFSDKDAVPSDEIPNPLMVLFIGHEHLGSRGWCCKGEAKLLFFILDTVVPRLRSPSLSRSLEQVCQYMEQCVFCLFGHPGKKTKLKYLVDHYVDPQSLNWDRAQQLYEIFRPTTLPEMEGKIPSITADTEQLFHRILALLPPESEPQKYISDIEKYINGKLNKLPTVPTLLPYKMKDIYFLMGDYYFKKEERKMSVKYNLFDIVVNNNRCESWAEIALAKAMNLELKINSSVNLDNEKDYLNPARSTIRCFKRALELDNFQYNLWIEYGIFVYTVYSFCSRLLKQASESLSMNDFESLEKQKEDMLNTTQKCFITVIEDRLSNGNDNDKVNDEMWLHYYMMGKVAEKLNKPPSMYLEYYMKAVKSLEEAEALYPLKINYNSPQHLSLEVLEVHYRIHASILKYIEQHENKPIPMLEGKLFLQCIEKWNTGAFTKKSKKEGGNEVDVDTKSAEVAPQAANILKRSISDVGEEDNQEAKRLKSESAAAKVRRSASYDTERTHSKDVSNSFTEQPTATILTIQEVEPVEKKGTGNNETTEPSPETKVNQKDNEKEDSKKNEDIAQHKKEETSSGTSSNSSSDSGSDDSSSSSSSDSSEDSNASSKSTNEDKPISDSEIMTIISACLNALEDCSSRFPQNYKAIYRLAHYHFYYNKGKDIERCRDLMLSNFTSRTNQKLGGLFCERKQSNFFNSVWRIPLAEVDRPGGFSYHMNRCVLLTMEILKEIDDHKTLLDLSMHLHRVPEPDKKYLRDADREDLAHQAFSLCVQSLKGQLVKFSQQADLKSNNVERQALNSLMLDIYRAYMKAQKQPNSRQLTNLLVDAYKLVSITPVNENSNLVDTSMRYCQSLISALKQKATQASIDKSNHIAQKKQAVKVAETIKSIAATAISTTPTQTLNTAQPITTSHITLTTTTVETSKPAATTSLPSKSKEMSNPFQSYLPMLNDPLLSQQTAAALSLSYLNNMHAMANYPLSNPLQSSFQSEFYRQFFSAYTMPGGIYPTKKQKRSKPTTSKSSSVPSNVTSVKSTSKSHAISSSHSKSASNAICGVPRSVSAPSSSLGSVITPTSSATFGSSVQPAHMPSTSQISHSTSQPIQAHMSHSTTVNTAIVAKPPLPHQQVSPGKTLQEKLAERQKNQTTMKSSAEMSSLSRLPSSLTITKSNMKAPPIKKPDAKKTLPFSDNSALPRPKQAQPPSEVLDIIVLDDDD